MRPDWPNGFLAEILHDDAWTEVGYAGSRRIRLRATPAPLASKAGQDAAILGQGEPVLITGGARGITSLVAAELARRWQPSLLLIGTTPVPDGPDDAELDGLASPAELKAALYERLRQRGTVRVAHGSRTGVPGARAARERSAALLIGCVPRARASSMPRSMSAIPPASPPS